MALWLGLPTNAWILIVRSRFGRGGAGGRAGGLDGGGGGVGRFGEGESRVPHSLRPQRRSLYDLRPRL